VFSHELAISYDQLGALVPMFPTESWEKGLQTVFPDLSPPIFKIPDHLAELRCALRDPAIRYAAAAERAFRFEDQVIADLGLSAVSPPLALHASCERILGERAVQISPLGPSLENEISAGLFREECGGVDLLKDADRTKTLVSRIKLVAATTLEFAQNGRRLSLCELILPVHIGPRQPDNLRHSGPRPRAGGWNDGG
jgi:hypothetical protein